MKNIKLQKSKGKKIRYQDTKVGLHCHCEENQEALIKLLDQAKKENAKFVAITNHKSLKIYTDILSKMPNELLERYKEIQLIPAVEMSAHFQYKDLDGRSYGIETHILGYGLDLGKEEILKKFVNNKYGQLNQEKELQRLIEIGHRIGLKFKDEDVYIDVTDGNRRFAGRAFMQAVMKNMEDNFNSEGEENCNKLPYELRSNWGAFYNRCVKDISSPFYLDVTTFNPCTTDVIDLIHEMGGKAYIAHPSGYFAKNGTKEQIERAYDNVVEFTKQFLEKHSPENNPKCAIDGIEMYHPSYLKNIKLLGKMKSLVELYSLGTSGGTDIHIGNIKTNSNTITDDSIKGKIAIRKLKRFKELKKLSKSIFEIRREVIRHKNIENER